MLCFSWASAKVELSRAHLLVSHNAKVLNALMRDAKVRSKRLRKAFQTDPNVESMSFGTQVDAMRFRLTCGPEWKQPPGITWALKWRLPWPRHLRYRLRLPRTCHLSDLERASV